MYLPLAPRYIGTCNPYYNNCNSGWYDWGRWVVLAAVIGGALVLFFLCSCLTARRRRTRGQQPFYGTGWTAPTHGTPQYYGNNNNNNDVNPAQSAPYYGSAGGYDPNNANAAPPYSPSSNAGYYGQTQGVELQQPQNSYYPNTGTNVYSPPAGPPPAKN